MPRPDLPAPMNDARARLWLVAILALAFGLRLYHAANHEFTNDDLANVRIADTIRLDPTDPHLVFASAGHPLLAVYLAHAGSVVFGPSIVGYRLPMVLAGTLTCWAVFRLGRRLATPAAGLWAAALLAVDQFHVTGSGTVHCHDILLLLFGTLALDTCLRLGDGARPGSFAALGAWMGLAYLGKETALLLWPALWLYFASSRARRAVLFDWRWYLAHGVFLAVISPDLAWNLWNASSGAGHLALSLSKAAAEADDGGYGKGVSFFFGEIVMWFEPAALGGEGYWCWPLRTIHWVAGLVYFGATLWATRRLTRPGFPLLVLCSAVTLGVVTLTRGQDYWDPFWWAAMALSPSVILAGILFDAWSASRRVVHWALLALVVGLLVRTSLVLRDVPFHVADCLESSQSTTQENTL
jgi:4-amino-4-deoxy-L-arabinose transferase-like glycosyltransferase